MGEPMIIDKTYQLDLTIDEILGLFVMASEGKAVLSDQDKLEEYIGGIEQVEAANHAYYKIGEAMRWALRERVDD